jgi:hypothetical protein
MGTKNENQVFKILNKNLKILFFSLYFEQAFSIPKKSKTRYSYFWRYSDPK